MNRLSYLAAMILLSTFACESIAGGVYPNAHDLMIEAISNGRASGIMTGQLAKKFADQFNSDSSLLVEASVIRSFKQVGCKRLQINYTKKNVPTPQGVTVVHFDTQINYCLDGSAPASQE